MADDDPKFALFSACDHLIPPYEVFDVPVGDGEVKGICERHKCAVTYHSCAACARSGREWCKDLRAPTAVSDPARLCVFCNEFKPSSEFTALSNRCARCRKIPHSRYNYWRDKPKAERMLYVAFIERYPEAMLSRIPFTRKVRREFERTGVVLKLERNRMHK